MADEKTTPNIPPKTSAAPTADGKTTPLATTDGKTAPLTPAGGKATPPTAADGKTAPPTAADGKTAPPTAADGKTNPATPAATGGKTTPTAAEQKSATPPSPVASAPAADLKIPLTPDGQPEKIEQMKVSDIHDFPGHPYSVKQDAEMTELVNSVKTHGVLNPAIVIPRKEGGYEMVSGHRRKFAAKLAGLDTIPVIVRRLTRDEAIISMVDSNLQRENISPMEKANAYKMKLEAMKRTAGRRAKGAAEQAPQKRADEQLAEQVGESRNTIQRMVRLTELEPGLAEMVDKGKLPVNPAADLSFLKKDEQKQLLDVMKERDITPSGQQATALKAASQNGNLSKDVIGQIMTPIRKEPELKVTLTYDKLKPYLPKKDCTPREAETHVMSALDSYKKKLERDQIKKTGPNLNGK